MSSITPSLESMNLQKKGMSLVGTAGESLPTIPKEGEKAMAKDIGNTEQTLGAILVDADRESWVLCRLTELVELTQSIQRLRSSLVGASENMVTGALEGAINGTAIEIIRTLGLIPSFTNIKTQPFNVHDRILRSSVLREL